MEKPSVIGIGNDSLNKLNLPKVELITENIVEQESLAILGQCIEALLSGNGLSEFRLKKLPQAIATIQKLSPSKIPSSDMDSKNANAWLDWVKALPKV